MTPDLISEQGFHQECILACTDNSRDGSILTTHTVQFCAEHDGGNSGHMQLPAYWNLLEAVLLYAIFLHQTQLLCVVCNPLESCGLIYSRRASTCLQDYRTRGAENSVPEMLVSLRKDVRSLEGGLSGCNRNSVLSCSPFSSTMSALSS